MTERNGSEGGNGTGVGERAARVCCASVCDGANFTQYRVAGEGAPVVLVMGDEAGAAAVLFERLRREFRVYAPESGGVARQGAASAWLRGFLDGLGLGEVALVAGPAFALAALGFSLLEYRRIRQLVLLVQDATDPAAPAGAVRDALTGVERPLLVVRLDDGGSPPVADVAEEVARFLLGEAPVS